MDIKKNSTIIWWLKILLYICIDNSGFVKILILSN